MGFTDSNSHKPQVPWSALMLSNERFATETKNRFEGNKGKKWIQNNQTSYKKQLEVKKPQKN